MDNFTALGILISDALAAAAYLFLFDFVMGALSSPGLISLYLVPDFDLSLTTGGGLLLALLALDRTGVGLCVLGGGGCWRFERFAKAPGDGVMERRFTEWRYDGDWSGGSSRFLLSIAFSLVCRGAFEGHYLVLTRFSYLVYFEQAVVPAVVVIDNT